MELNPTNLPEGIVPPESAYDQEQMDHPSAVSGDGIAAGPTGELDPTKYHKITAEDIAKEQYEKDKKATSGKFTDLAEMLSDTISTEDARLETLEKPEMKKEIIDIKKEQGTYKWATESRREAESKGEGSTYQTEAVRLADFAPDYTEDDYDNYTEPVGDSAAPTDQAAPKKPDAADEDEDPRADLYREIMALPALEGLVIPKNNFVQTVRDKKPYTEVKSVRAREEGDTAFMNAISKFKKTNYRTVKVPLVNSGFWADMVGTGPQDLILLYQNVTRGIAGIDYEVERMKATIKGVVSTTPKVPMELLRNKIHFADYPLMAYGRLVATFKEISPIGTCPQCGNEMRFKANPEDLLMNVDEMQDRINAMREVQSYEEMSLLAFDRKYEFEGSGITVTVGHPSYIEMVSHMNSLKFYSNDNHLSSAEQQNFIAQMNFLAMIRTVVLPNGVRAANIYQKYVALKLLEEEEFNQLVDCVEELTKMAVVPKFGVKDIICPHCGKKADINIASVDDLVFYHSTVYQAERFMKKNSSTNG